MKKVSTGCSHIFIVTTSTSCNPSVWADRSFIQQCTTQPRPRSVLHLRRLPPTEPRLEPPRSVIITGAVRVAPSPGSSRTCPPHLAAPPFTGRSAVFSAVPVPIKTGLRSAPLRSPVGPGVSQEGRCRPDRRGEEPAGGGRAPAGTGLHAAAAVGL